MWDTLLIAKGDKKGDEMKTEEDLRTQPDSVPNYVAQLFTLSEKMLSAGVDGWAVEVRVIANSLAEGLNLDGQVA